MENLPAHTTIGSFLDNPQKKTKCPQCGLESVEGIGMCIQIGANKTDFCPVCFLEWVSKNVPKMERT